MKTHKFKQTEIGMIPDDWEVKRIGDLFNVKNGKTNSQDAVENGQYPLFDRSMKVKKSNKFLFDSEAIIVPGEGKEFIPRYFNGKFDLHQRAYAITPKDTAHHLKFFFYAVLEFKDYLSRMAVGSTVRSLRLNHLTSFPVPFPNIEDQEAISKILSDLDSKIELNQQMNKTLEAIGQAIFKRWFVDFEFPNEKGKPYKSSGGEMVDSELGEIPRGWKVGKLGDFVYVERGLSYKGSGLCENGIPMINLGNIAPNNHFKYDGLKYYSGEYKERNLVKPGDLIIANTDITQNRTVLGSCLIVPSDLDSDKIIFTHHIYAVRHKNLKLSNHFLSFLLQTPEYRERASGFATGTTVLALPEDAILNFNFVLPSDDLMKKYTILISHLKNKTAVNIKEAKNLSQIRDSLLPKLMNGGIRVKWK